MVKQNTFKASDTGQKLYGCFSSPKCFSFFKALRGLLERLRLWCDPNIKKRRKWKCQDVALNAEARAGCSRLSVAKKSSNYGYGYFEASYSIYPHETIGEQKPANKVNEEVN